LIEKRNPGGPDLFTVDDFTYDPVQDTLNCPAGHLASYHRRAVFNTEEQKKRGSIFQFKPEQCNSCEFKPLCNKSKKGRSVYISYYDPFYKQMKERLATEEGQAVYKNRYKIEHKVADLARYCGMRRCRYRGLVRAKIHTLLAATASNVKRMVRLLCPSKGEVCQNGDKPPLETVIAC
jgi:hypothetical protein